MRQKSTTTKNADLHLRLSDQDDAALHRRAAEERTTKSAIARRLIVTGLAREQREAADDNR